MIPTPSISEHARTHISAILQEIERTHGIEILIAAESGSRAWGFPSADSDYDVRILYRRTIPDYLSILRKRDVIELPIVFDDVLDADLDVNGWDIQKALYLALQSNTTLLEWLSSPLHYIWQDHAADRLLRFVRETGDLDWFAFRYDRPARHAMDEILSSQEPVKLKRYFYALRPALACRWILEHRQAPPMDLPALIAGLSIPTRVLEEIERLWELKQAGSEALIVPRCAVLDDYLAASLQDKAGKVSDAEPAPQTIESANMVFRELVLASG